MYERAAARACGTHVGAEGRGVAVALRVGGALRKGGRWRGGDGHSGDHGLRGGGPSVALALHGPAQRPAAAQANRAERLAEVAVACGHACCWSGPASGRGAGRSRVLRTPVIVSPTLSATCSHASISCSMWLAALLAGRPHAHLEESSCERDTPVCSACGCHQVVGACASL